MIIGKLTWDNNIIFNVLQKKFYEKVKAVHLGVLIKYFLEEKLEGKFILILRY